MVPPSYAAGMGIRLSEDEAWALLDTAHTGILTTLRADGTPVALPVWFVTDGRTICFSAPSGTKKVARVRRDPRASFLVESGLRWAELAAVHLDGDVAVVDDDVAAARIASRLDEKYAAFRTAATSMPATARQHYATRTLLRFVPRGRILSWDNSRMELTP